MSHHSLYTAALCVFVWDWMSSTSARWKINKYKIVLKHSRECVDALLFSFDQIKTHKLSRSRNIQPSWPEQHTYIEQLPESENIDLFQPHNHRRKSEAEEREQALLLPLLRTPDSHHIEFLNAKSRLPFNREAAHSTLTLFSSHTRQKSFILLFPLRSYFLLTLSGPLNVLSNV